MERYWKTFWKIFGAATGVMFIFACVFGIVKQSSQVTYTLIQQIFAVAFGIFGFIGFIVVPIDMFIEDRKQERANRAAQ
jgi:preprotein translocase subunit Sss1